MENRIWQGKEWERSQSGGQRVQTTGLEVTSANKEKPGILHWDNRKGVLRKIITHQEFQILQMQIHLKRECLNREYLARHSYSKTASRENTIPG